METFWFVALAGMLAVYAVLDGFDLGVGFVHGFLARTPEERRTVMETIGPYWDGNEVWLIAAGGVMFFAFPILYAASFSGFYLPLMIVLWLLMLRGVAIEFGSHMESALWRVFWDRVFAGASMALALVFGAALGNVVRGVPVDSRFEFFVPLWTDFSARGRLGVLDWYTLLVGALAAAALAMHGALWVRLKLDGVLRERASRFARRIWWVVAALVAAVSWATFSIQPLVRESFAAGPWKLLFPIAAVAGLGLARLGWFAGSAMFLAGMMASAAAGLYPYVLPPGLTVENARSGKYALRGALYWWVPALLLAAGYFTFLYTRFAGGEERQARKH